MDLSYKKILFVMVMLYLLTRLAALLLLDFQPITSIDELSSGAIAKEIINKPFVPLFYLRPEEYTGGVLVTGILTVPFFLTLGDSYFSLKLVPILFSLCSLVLLFAVLRRFASLRIATVASLLYLFCPPFLIESNITEYWHCESTLFTLASIYFFLRAIYTKSGHRARDFCLAGLTIGFGIYFMPSFLITPICILIFWYVLDKRFVLRKSFLYFTIFLIIGLVPFIHDSYYYDPGPLQWLLRAGGHRITLGRIFSKLYSLLLVQMPNSFSFKDMWFIRATALNWGYYLITIIGFCAAIWSYRRSLSRFLLGLLSIKGADARDIKPVTIFFIYPLLYLAAYSLVRFRVNLYSIGRPVLDYRYLAPIYPFLFIVLSLALDRLADWSRRISQAGIATVASICLLANLFQLRIDEFGEVLRYRGYSYVLFGVRLAELNLNNPNRGLALIYSGIEDEGDKEECLIGFCESLAEEYLNAYPKNTVQEYAAYLAKVDPEYRPQCYRSLGRFAGGRMGKELLQPGVLDRWRKEFQGVSDKNMRYCYEGLGQIVATWVDLDERECMSALKPIPPQFRIYCYEGMERQLDRWNRPRNWRNESSVNEKILRMKEQEGFITPGN